MEFIHSKLGEIDYGKYETYVQSIREKLPKHIYDFAANPNHFNLQSHSSLHDAWLESLVVKEAASGERNEIRKLEVKMSLLGPFHDRWIHLHYTGVTRYSFDTPARYDDTRYDDTRYEHTAHGDLFTHEIRLGQHGLFVHELLFERDATFLIECSDIRHSEELITDTDSSSPDAGKHGF
jgi:hypothetical protein